MRFAAVEALGLAIALDPLHRRVAAQQAGQQALQRATQFNAVGNVAFGERLHAVAPVGQGLQQPFLLQREERNHLALSEWLGGVVTRQQQAFLKVLLRITLPQHQALHKKHRVVPFLDLSPP